MKDQEMLEKVRAEVSSAIQMLKERHPGADLAGGKRLLEEAAGAIEKNAWSQAIELAQKAQLAAKPTTEYLLSRAKNLEARGSQAYKDEKYSEAIGLWRKTLDEYAKVKEVARERKEVEILKALESIIASIVQDIKVAERNRANTEMLALVEQANKAVDEAKKRYEASDFDTAIKSFESARELYAKGAKIAVDFDFKDKQRLDEAQAEMATSIDACYIAKAETMIEAASKEEGNKKEKAFLKTIDYLDSLSSITEGHKELKERAYSGLVSARIDVGTRLMEGSEALMGKADYYNAKEEYRKAQQHFADLLDFVVEHRLEREKGKIDSLMEGCTGNINVCIKALMYREPVDPVDIVTVEKIGKGIPSRPKTPQPGEDTKSILERDYKWVKYLASGGFGEVWQAQTRDEQTIALKILREKTHEDIFFKELRIWQKLVHRNIVKLIRPRLSPLPLFEMEYIDGGDLKKLMEKTGRIAPEIACRIASDVARGLEYAHLSKVIHADLKPRNILLTMTTKEAKISDWGLGKIATSSSKARGYTEGYAAPEQILNLSLDNKTDVYQLGLVFYEMLTGNNPFQVALAKTEDSVPTLALTKPSTFNSKVVPLDDLIIGCLEKEPANRPTIREFRDTLKKYMNDSDDVSVSHSSEPKQTINLLLEISISAAKDDDHNRCLGSLNSVCLKLRNRGLKEKFRGLMTQIEVRDRQGYKVSNDEFINELYSLQRQVEYEQS